MRTAIYVDGFNLYYGALKNTCHKWLDVLALARNLLKPTNDVVRVRYFTALVSDTKGDPRKSTRQTAYLNALTSHVPCLSIHYGDFQRQKVKLPSACNHYKLLRVIRTEEKGSDVNLAVHMLNDAWNDEYDCAVVMSNDSDLTEACRLVRQRRKLVGIAAPVWRPTSQLRQNSDFFRRIESKHLRRSQLPATIPGTNIKKPSSW